ncbi:tegument protein UL7 [Equid gammaherpesvirus 5]|uniref:Tegument protein UL7 n=1 Tax=Equid gammaherpesvirus 5 TaxID=10371 RepID=A0A0B4Q6R5_9GAMA|nr:tegument protein UL7 [Equid gammaherpesvirus 5]AIU39566.1 tegument protein UL7 [Equid gammaherpesvirus 5]APT43411.1 tegument protein UL7 [Equid gammaherpesvirus 5]
MDTLKLFTGVPKKEYPTTAKTVTPMYPNPMVARMVLEVNSCENLCVACNSPDLLKDGALSVSQLLEYVKQKLVSDTFVGFAMACLLDCEDLVDSINLLPHVFERRVFVYRPSNSYVLELCVLASMLENRDSYTKLFVDSLLGRARFVYSKNPCIDACFLLHSIETLASTVMDYYKLDPHGSRARYPSLMMYKLHAAIEGGSVESKGLLRPIYHESYKLYSDPDASFDEDCEEEAGDGRVTFNMFYCDTIFTKHLRSEAVVKTFKARCLEGCPRPNILS